MLYPVFITRDTDDSYLVRSRDIPEAFAVGYSEEEAIKEALNGLESAFMIYMSDRIPIPLPSKKVKGEHLIKLPFRVSLKVALYNSMLEKGLRKADLAKDLKWDQKQVDRLLSLNHSTKLEAIEEAFNVINKDIDLVIA